LGMASEMAQTYLCGHCGAPLPGASARCVNCGMGPAASAAYARRKLPWLAAGLSIIPGLGHIYLGHYKKGLVYLVASSGLEFFGFDLDLTAIGAMIGVPMELGGLGLMAHSAWDAYHLAKRGDYR
jgi:hypothetical protein